jgi:phytoene/squalene synthetase
MNTREEFIRLFESIDFEKILDHPNILIAANFWDEARYQAARTCYRFMRNLDDQIDNYKAEHRGITEEEKARFKDIIKQWLGMLQDGRDLEPFSTELTDTVKRFRIPVWALESFAESMLYDVNNDGFATLSDFVQYSGGASVAPASVFVHLAGLKENQGTYYDPPFNVRRTASPCAMFSYFVHIIRDFRKDQLNNLCCFADDIIVRHQLTRNDLKNIAKGAPITTGFREMMMEYYRIADGYRLSTLKVMDEVCPLLEPRYRLSLEIIFNLYMMVFERIDPYQGTFSTEELNPTPFETRERVRRVIERSKA